MPEMDPDELAPAPAPAPARNEPSSAPPREDEEALLARAQNVISRILEREHDPNPRLLHTLATMCEHHEARYLHLSASNPTPNSTNTRSTYTIGKLANLFRDNDDFYELVFCKFLSDTSYSVAIRAAAARLLLSCHSTWTPQYPHAFEDSIIDNVKKWVTDDSEASSECEWQYLGRNKPTDAEMLRTYAIGLLAMALCSGGQLVEDVLNMGVSAKLMRFLCVRVLGDASSSQKDSNHPQDTKHPRGRDDSRGKSRLAQDVSRLDGTRVGCGILTDLTAEKYNEPGFGMRQVHGERLMDDTVASSDNSDAPEADRVNDRSYGTSTCDVKSKFGERHSVIRLAKDEDISENGELLKRKLNRATSRLRVKGKAGESLPESEIMPLSPTSGLRIGGRAIRDRNAVGVDDPKKGNRCE